MMLILPVFEFLVFVNCAFCYHRYHARGKWQCSCRKFNPGRVD